MANVIDMSSERRVKSNQRGLENFGMSRPRTTLGDAAGSQGSGSAPTGNVNLSMSSVSERTEQPQLREKGHAIPGIDYGIDLLSSNDDRNKRAASSPSPQHSQFQNSNSNPNPPNLQHLQQHQSMSVRSASPPSPPMPGMPGMGMMDESGSTIGSDMGGGFVNNSARERITQFGQPQQMGYEEIRKKKIDYVADFRRLKSQGYVPDGQKDITMSTGLEEMEDIVQRLNDQRDLDNSIKFQRKILIGFSGLVESVCETEDWNIFELNLSGWSQNITDNISEYDEVFEELYHKYKDKVSLAPEIKLIGMVAGSAYMFHMTRDVFNRDSGKLPGVEAVMQRDPEFRRRYQELATEIAREKGVSPYNPNRGGGMGSLMNLFGGMTGNAGAPQRQPPQQRTQMPQQQIPQQQMPQQRRMAPQQQRPQQQRPQRMPPQQQKQPSPPRRTRTRIPMDDPDDVDGLLQSLNQGPESSDGLYQQDELDLSEIDRFSELN